MTGLSIKTLAEALEGATLEGQALWTQGEYGKSARKGRQAIRFRFALYAKSERYVALKGDIIEFREHDEYYEGILSEQDKRNTALERVVEVASLYRSAEDCAEKTGGDAIIWYLEKRDELDAALAALRGEE